MTILKGKLGFKGERGYSNYEIYVKNGGELTEQEWLDHFGVDLTDVLKTQDTVDNLTSTSTTKPLSANQGKTLNTSITTTNTNLGNVANLTTTNKSNTVAAINELNSGKQASLTSGTNIKTINGNSILGSGNLVLGDVVYSDWSKTISCDPGMTVASIEVPTITGYTCIANVLRANPSSYIIVTLGSNGDIRAYNTSGGTIATYSIMGRFIYKRNT